MSKRFDYSSHQKSSFFYFAVALTVPDKSPGRQFA